MILHVSKYPPNGIFLLMQCKQNKQCTNELTQLSLPIKTTTYIELVSLNQCSSIPYSRKIWRELYMAIWPPTAEIQYWWNLNLAICDCEAKFHYVILACGYAIHMIRPSRNLAEIKFGGAVGDRQTVKLNSPPNFPAIRYSSINKYVLLSVSCIPQSSVLQTIVRLFQLLIAHPNWLVALHSLVAFKTFAEVF